MKKQNYILDCLCILYPFLLKLILQVSDCICVLINEYLEWVLLALLLTVNDHWLQDMIINVASMCFAAVVQIH